jgi:hypothetical protein
MTPADYARSVPWFVLFSIVDRMLDAPPDPTPEGRQREIALLDLTLSEMRRRAKAPGGAAAAELFALSTFGAARTAARAHGRAVALAAREFFGPEWPGPIRSAAGYTEADAVCEADAAEAYAAEAATNGPARAPVCETCGHHWHGCTPGNCRCGRVARARARNETSADPAEVRRTVTTGSDFAHRYGGRAAGVSDLLTDDEIGNLPPAARALAADLAAVEIAEIADIARVAGVPVVVLPPGTPAEDVPSKFFEAWEEFVHPAPPVGWADPAPGPGVGWADPPAPPVAAPPTPDNTERRWRRPAGSLPRPLRPLRPGERCTRPESHARLYSNEGHWFNPAVIRARWARTDDAGRCFYVEPEPQAERAPFTRAEVLAIGAAVHTEAERAACRACAEFDAAEATAAAMIAGPPKSGSSPSAAARPAPPSESKK